MAAVVVRVEGLSSTVRSLALLGLDVDDLKDAMASIARDAADIIKAHTPVGPTGRLRADVRGNRAKAKAVVSAGRSSIPYAAPRNYGWRAHNITGAFFMQSADGPMQTRAPFALEVEINRLITVRGLG
jgi:hypothetical protein